MQESLSIIETLVAEEEEVAQIIKQGELENMTFDQVFTVIIQLGYLDYFFRLFRNAEPYLKSSTPIIVAEGDPTPLVYMFKYIKVNDDRGFLPVFDYLVKQGYLSRLYVTAQLHLQADEVLCGSKKTINLVLDDSEELDQIVSELENFPDLDKIGSTH